MGEPIEFRLLESIAGRAEKVSRVAVDSVGAEGFAFHESFAVS